MEIRYKLLVLLLILVLGVSLVSAATISSITSVNLNENFNFKIAGDGTYAVEINIPDSFQIVADASGGVRTNGVYKTFTSDIIYIVLRPTKSGSFTFDGKFTSGDGVKNLNTFTINVRERPTGLSCPTCPIDSGWSNCQGGKQMGMTYECSSSTGYICTPSFKTRFCLAQQTCQTQWVCSDENKVAYQSSDCSLSSVQECRDGCEEGKCVVKAETKALFEDNLNVTITNGDECGFFCKIQQFFTTMWQNFFG